MMSFISQGNSKFIFFMVITAIALVLAACSAPAEQLNQEGNQAFTEQAYLESLGLYQSAQIESPELSEPYFNAANAFYRQGDYPAALEQMQVALQYVEEDVLAESSFYNMGNTLFNSQDLSTAVEAYKQALLLNPGDQDAKYNLELALQQQQEQQQEQNEDQQGEDSESESESQDQSEEGQESENGENQAENSQDQEGDQSQENGEEDSHQGSDQENGTGEPQEDQNSQDDGQPSQTPPPGQRMTEEQAKQLLAAIANDMQTLQERLGQYLFARQAPPVQDW